eukprot:3798050-Rhodomonas_salina.1
MGSFALRWGRVLWGVAYWGTVGCCYAPMRCFVPGRVGSQYWHAIGCYATFSFLDWDVLGCAWYWGAVLGSCRMVPG